MSNNGFDLGPCMGALNAYEPRTSLDFDDRIQLSVLVGDFSRSFAMEAFEPRWMMHANLPASGVAFGMVMVRPASKPVVIERVFAPQETLIYMGDGTPPGSVSPSFGGTLQVGALEGSQVENQFGYDTTQVGQIAGTETFRMVPDDIGAERLFVPPGRSLMFHGLTNTLFELGLRGRELPAMPRVR